MRSYSIVLVCFLGSFSLSASAQQANTQAAYHALRTLQPVPLAMPVENLTLTRDAGVFTFTRGEIALFGEVNGKVTGAVFAGTGHFHLTPPTAVERHSLEVLTKKPEFDEDFTVAVLRFTDETAAELKKGAKPTQGATEDKTFTEAEAEFRTFQREHLHENVDLRLLEDVLSPAPGGFFLAAMKGVTNHNLLFEIDPHGASEVAPEEVLLGSWNGWGWTYPAAFHLAGEYAAGTASGRQQNKPFKVTSEELETSIEKNGYLGGQATVHLEALADGVAVVPFDLFPTLRVSKVEGEHGDALDFVQEKKEDDPDFGLVLAAPLKAGQTTVVHITYGGKDAVKNAGSDNYDPIAREDWFPNGGTGLGNYSTYHMVFHVAKDTQLIATGNKISETVDGKVRTSVWESGMPLPVVGFHLGKFEKKEGKTPSGVDVTALANGALPDWASGLNRAAAGDDVPVQGESHMAVAAVGNMNTTGMLPVELSQGAAAIQVYESFYGKLPFDHVALSQQPACNYGQSWPMLVYLPICGFWDGTIQHQLGLKPDDQYWKTVTAHEVAHQWWGHTVGFMSYRDQWMSEGFADASAAFFLQATRKTDVDYLNFWKELRRQLTERNTDGFRPIDVGPVTMGFRLSSQKTGWGVYQNLVYPKGAYILYMLRQMMATSKNGDLEFRARMHDFVDTYRLTVATTDDFKAMVEQPMTPAMDLDGNHRMDWFFNEYVYGTELPKYHFESDVTDKGDGVMMHFKLTQSGVSETFKARVPVYVELSDGRTVELGRVLMVGNKTDEESVPMAKPPVPIKRLAINSMYDLLAVEN